MKISFSSYCFANEQFKKTNKMRGLKVLIFFNLFIFTLAHS